jgi:hypothetical protein
LPQFGQTAGLRPASSASRPTGKKQMETTIAHVGKPPWGVNVLHLGQDTCAITASSKKSVYPGQKKGCEQESVIDSGEGDELRRLQPARRARGDQDELRDDEQHHARSGAVRCHSLSYLAAKEQGDTRRDSTAWARTAQQRFHDATGQPHTERGTGLRNSEYEREDQRRSADGSGDGRGEQRNRHISIDTGCLIL